MTDKAFEALKGYDFGTDRNVLKPIDEAVVATHGDVPARKELETKVAAVLETDVSLDAKQFACRTLMVIGTAASVPKIAKLLSDEKLSHMARFALERNDAPEAGAALRDALPKVSDDLKIGVIGSLGSRQDEESVAALGKLLGETNSAVARSAALALGAIRSPAAAKALSANKPSAETRSAVTDASLACAESLLADGKKVEALAVYKSVAGADQPKHVRLAATRGMLACAGK